MEVKISLSELLEPRATGCVQIWGVDVLHHVSLARGFLFLLQ